MSVLIRHWLDQAAADWTRLDRPDPFSQPSSHWLYPPVSVCEIFPWLRWLVACLQHSGVRDGSHNNWDRGWERRRTWLRWRGMRGWRGCWHQGHARSVWLRTVSYPTFIVQPSPLLSPQILIWTEMKQVFVFWYSFIRHGHGVKSICWLCKQTTIDDTFILQIFLYKYCVSHTPMSCAEMVGTRLAELSHAEHQCPMLAGQL